MRESCLIFKSMLYALAASHSVWAFHELKNFHVNIPASAYRMLFFPFCFAQAAVALIISALRKDYHYRCIADIKTTHNSPKSSHFVDSFTSAKTSWDWIGFLDAWNSHWRYNFMQMKMRLCVERIGEKKRAECSALGCSLILDSRGFEYQCDKNEDRTRIKNNF